MIDSESLKGKWIDLDDRALFRITGSDRVRYVNGQVTNDVGGPLQEKAIAACLCTVKGKVEALVWISADQDSLWLDGQLDQRDQLFERLDRYLIADDCEIHDETGKLRLIHHFDPTLGGVPSKRTAIEGFDLWTTPEAVAQLPEDKRLKAEEFSKAQLFARIPQAPYEITANEFPAELGIDSWAVDFKKGCYLGQEVISRIKSVGRVKRHLSLVHADSPINQNAELRNSEGAVGIATRPSQQGSNFFYYSLALFSSARSESETADFQKVKEIHERDLGNVERSS